MSSASSWPAVSVVVTCYNLETYIGEALGSVLAQDYAGRVELTVVDDASSDGSVAAIQRVPGVNLVMQATNGGVLQAMLAGIAHASHDLLFLLDGDDVWEVDKLRRSVEAFLDDPAIGFVTHNISHIDARSQPIDRANRVERSLSAVPAERMSEHLRRSILEMRDDVWLGSAMGLRRSLIDADGFATFASTLPDPANCYQDWPLAYWIAAQPNVGMAYVHKPLLRYRLHGANYSGDAGSAERAARNFGRAANTLEAMIAIGHKLGVRQVGDALVERAISYRYLSNLYRRGGLASVSAFLRSASSFRRRGLLIKEAVRLAAMMVVGPDRFARWAARRATALDLPTS